MIKKRLFAALIHMKYNVLFRNKSQELTSHILLRLVHSSRVLFFIPSLQKHHEVTLVVKEQRSLI